MVEREGERQDAHAADQPIGRLDAGETAIGSRAADRAAGAAEEPPVKRLKFHGLRAGGQGRSNEGPRGRTRGTWGARHAADARRIPEHDGIALVVSAAIPAERARLGIAAMRHGEDFMPMTQPMAPAATSSPALTGAARREMLGVGDRIDRPVSPCTLWTSPSCASEVMPGFSPRCLSFQNAGRDAAGGFGGCR
jgi:hypothetical protein